MHICIDYKQKSIRICDDISVGKRGVNNMSDKNIRIAILDDGVHPKACPLAGSFLIDNDLSVSSQKENTVSPYPPIKQYMIQPWLYVCSYCAAIY